MIDNKETKTENLRLQKCPLKKGYFWKLVISLETYMKERLTSRLSYMEDLVFLENKIV